LLVIPAEAGIQLCSVLSLVIPAKAGIQFLLVIVLKAKASTRPTDERVPFFARAKKGTKETRPSALRPLGILPNGFASSVGFR